MIGLSVLLGADLSLQDNRKFIELAVRIEASSVLVSRIEAAEHTELSKGWI